VEPNGGFPHLPHEFPALPEMVRDRMAKKPTGLKEINHVNSSQAQTAPES
jgi:hypothetical protein